MQNMGEGEVQGAPPPYIVTEPARAKDKQLPSATPVNSEGSQAALG